MVDNSAHCVKVRILQLTAVTTSLVPRPFCLDTRLTLGMLG